MTLLAYLLSTSGCSTHAASPHRAPPDTSGPDHSAVLVAPSDTVRAELARAVTEAMGAPVRLAADALTSDSRLIITRVVLRDSAGRPLLGRSTEKPHLFHLIQHDGRCILVEDRTARRWELRSATCVPSGGR